MSRGIPVVRAARDQEEEETLMAKTNTVTPCAACRLLRRRCAEDCPFSPYFSPNEPLKFASVHRVFGASNVAKMLTDVPENQRADTANSLAYEATLRLRDPVYGCVGVISILQRQVQSLEAELNVLRAELLRYKLRAECNFPISRPLSITAPPAPPPSQPPPLPTTSSTSSTFMQANSKFGPTQYRF